MKNECDEHMERDEEREEEMGGGVLSFPQAANQPRILKHRYHSEQISRSALQRRPD